MPAPGAGRPGTDPLAVVHAGLRARLGTHGGPFHVPAFLAGAGRADTLLDVGDPYAFLDAIITSIRARTAPAPPPAGIGPQDRVYLAFPRTFAALDGRVGTALSQLAFLPYLRDQLEVSVLICLPTGVIGATARKGGRGSPFAVANPFDVDPSLADPLLSDLPALVQYQALVQACRSWACGPARWYRWPR